MTAEWILTDKELSEVLASQGNWKDDIYKVRDAQAKKLLEYLIALPDNECLMLTINTISKGAILKYTLESMLKQLEEGQ